MKRYKLTPPQPIPHPDGATCPLCGGPTLWFQGDHIRKAHPAFERRRFWCLACIRKERVEEFAERLILDLSDSEADGGTFSAWLDEQPSRKDVIDWPELETALPAAAARLHGEPLTDELIAYYAGMITALRGDWQGLLDWQQSIDEQEKE